MYLNIFCGLVHIIVCGSILLEIFTAKGQAAEAELEKRAILVGINKKADDFQKLRVALEKSGYTCRTLINEQATLYNIRGEFFSDQLQSGILLDTFVFYYSGLSTQVKDDINADEKDGLDECLLPYDVRSNEPSTYLWDDDFIHWINSIKAKNIIVILDCLVSGGIEIEESENAQWGTVIISALKPDKVFNDDAFTVTLTQVLSEREEKGIFIDEDGNDDRLIDLNEVQQYFRERQIPLRINPSEKLGIHLIELTPLTKVIFPSDATIKILNTNEELRISEKEFRHGAYKIQIIKDGYHKKDHEFYIQEGEKEKKLDVPLEKIKVAVNIACSQTAALEGAVLSIQDTFQKENIYEEQITEPGEYSEDVEFTPGRTYDLTVNGRGLKNIQRDFFTYEGHTDISRNLNVEKEDTPPSLQNVKLTSEKNLTLGSQLTIEVKASDTGIGLDDSSVTIQFQKDNTDKKLSLELIGGVSFQEPDIYTYKFQYIIPNEESYLGEWTVSKITLKDKLGNFSTPPVPAELDFKISQTGFESAEDYYNQGRYEQAITLLEAMEYTDNRNCLLALSHYQQGEIEGAVWAFMNIGTKDIFLSDNISPKMPKEFVGVLWKNELVRLRKYELNRDNLQYDKENLKTSLEDAAVYAKYIGRNDASNLYQKLSENPPQTKTWFSGTISPWVTFVGVGSLTGATATWSAEDFRFRTGVTITLACTFVAILAFSVYNYF